MGSLMAGWDSPVLNSKPDVYKRNQSLTKDEIEAYWRANNELHHTTTIQEIKADAESGRKLQKSNSFPVAKTKETDIDERKARKIRNNNGWWTLSNWAFLNEPPLLEGTSNTYASQFHVPNWAPKSDTPDQITT
ncbi:uncharacterized protein Pyn_36940 [Prunus yedoensis var. nudiflora]|uniref:Uncharacterized protein n=1 Tax=Prunus yedoensis var. nudiflora TaxID=2094558 RepID=A0A314Y9F9_PRUYE|nr:uncharacterized protein Pyn_36940 [Prunus yedoensis var. nudiflora]